MSTANEQSLWRRVRFTPLRDALRGRITGRLDTQRLIDTADLPAAARELVRRVVRQTRLWPMEKADVAGELIAHFRDGLDDGVTVEQLMPSSATRGRQRA